jgi:hypothetical protein
MAGLARLVGELFASEAPGLKEAAAAEADCPRKAMVTLRLEQTLRAKDSFCRAAFCRMMRKFHPLSWWQGHPAK